MVDEIGRDVGTDGAAHEHAVTYGRFMSIMKWSVVALAVLLILLAIFLA